MAQDNMQLQRWELKYLIPEEVALALREFVSSYLEIDEYGAHRPNLSYSIHNLYLDSEDLRIYWGTINGNKNRFKLRLRFYADSPDPQAPVFFEIKRRTNDAILKQRCGVQRSVVEAVLGGQLPEVVGLVSQDAGCLSAALAMLFTAGRPWRLCRDQVLAAYPPEKRQRRERFADVMAGQADYSGAELDSELPELRRTLAALGAAGEGELEADQFLDLLRRKARLLGQARGSTGSDDLAAAIRQELGRPFSTIGGPGSPSS